MNDDTSNTYVGDALSNAALRLMAERAAGDPFYLAHSLDAYQRAHRVADSDLARELDCSEQTLLMVFLCRQPDPGDAARFNKEVQEIAARFGLSAGRLASLIRKASRVAAPGTRFTTRPAAYGMAAQDREPEPEPDLEVGNGEPEGERP